MKHMKVTVAAFLVLGVAAPVYAQQGSRVKNRAGHKDNSTSKGSVHRGLCNNSINRPDNGTRKPDGCSAPTRMRWNLSIWRTTWTSSRSASIAEPAKVAASYFIGSCNRQ